MEAPIIEQVEFTEEDHAKAAEIAKRLGYDENTAYTSTSGLWGLACLPFSPEHDKGKPTCGGFIIKTKQFGLMFVQDLEDLHMDDLRA